MAFSSTCDGTVILAEIILSISFEKEPLEKLAKGGKLVAYRHTGFWKAMDTLRDKRELENLFINGNPPWGV